jgi:hypothetical protein
MSEAKKNKKAGAAKERAALDDGDIQLLKTYVRDFA